MLALVTMLLLGSPDAAADCCAAGSDLPAPPVPGAVPTPSAEAGEASTRLGAGAGAALGALVGGLVGGPMALGLGAALIGEADEAVAVPVIALPPVLVALGAGLGGLSAGDGRAAWAAGIAGTVAAGAVSVTAGLVLLQGEGVIANDRGLTFAVLTAGPALAAALLAGPAAAIAVDVGAAP